jgi:hypothetical protein
MLYFRKLKKQLNILLHVHPFLGNGLVNTLSEDRFLVNSWLLGYAIIEE